MMPAGCSLPGLGKPSVVSLTKDAVANLNKVSSAQVNIQTDGDVSAVYETLNIGMNITLDTDSDLELTKDLARAKGRIGMMKYLSDGSVTAELKEETVEINGQEAYQISGSLSGDFLK